MRHPAPPQAMSANSDATSVSDDDQPMMAGEGKVPDVQSDASDDDEPLLAAPSQKLDTQYMAALRHLKSDVRQIDGLSDLTEKVHTCLYNALANLDKYMADVIQIKTHRKTELTNLHGIYGQASDLGEYDPSKKQVYQGIADAATAHHFTFDFVVKLRRGGAKDAVNGDKDANKGKIVVDLVYPSSTT